MIPPRNQDKPPEVNISDYHRAPVIYALLLVFLLLFLILGGKTGLKALAGTDYHCVTYCLYFTAFKFSRCLSVIYGHCYMSGCHYCQPAFNLRADAQGCSRHYWHRMWCAYMPVSLLI